jgi:hypothetical protein
MGFWSRELRPGGAFVGVVVFEVPPDSQPVLLRLVLGDLLQIVDWRLG